MKSGDSENGLYLRSRGSIAKTNYSATKDQKKDILLFDIIGNSSLMTVVVVMVLLLLLLTSPYTAQTADPFGGVA